jgi:hypothetical protein
MRPPVSRREQGAHDGEIVEIALPQIVNFDERGITDKSIELTLELIGGGALDKVDSVASINRESNARSELADFTRAGGFARERGFEEQMSITVDSERRRMNATRLKPSFGV